MLKVIKCPSCAAPLECDGDAFEKCDFCGSQVAVAQNNIFSEHSLGFDGLLKNAQILKEILRLVRSGNKIEAIKLYRQTFNCSLAEAKDAVERLERGQSVNFQKVRFQSFEPIQINPEAAKTALKAVGYFSGSVLLIAGGIILLTAFIIIGVFWTVKSKIDNTLKSDTKNITKTSFANEILRFGGEGVGAGNFKDNRVVAVDDEGKIYSADYHGGRIQVFDNSGKFLTQWFLENKDSYIRAMAASRNGTIYITTGDKVSSFEGATGKLLNEAKVNFVDDLAVTIEGKVIVTDGESITVLDSILKNIANYKDVNKTAGITKDFKSITVNGLGEIYAIADDGKDVCKFSADGKFLDRFKTQASSVNGLAVDAKGRIFIAETSKIWVYQPDGNFANSFDTKQCFAMTFNNQGELIIASRPYVVKYTLNQ